MTFVSINFIPFVSFINPYIDRQNDLIKFYSFFFSWMNMMSYVLFDRRNSLFFMRGQFLGFSTFLFLFKEVLSEFFRIFADFFGISKLWFCCNGHFYFDSCISTNFGILVPRLFFFVTFYRLLVSFSKYLLLAIFLIVIISLYQGDGLLSRSFFSEKFVSPLYVCSRFYKLWFKIFSEEKR